MERKKGRYDGSISEESKKKKIHTERVIERAKYWEDEKVKIGIKGLKKKKITEKLHEREKETDMHV